MSGDESGSFVNLLNKNLFNRNSVKRETFRTEK